MSKIQQLPTFLAILTLSRSTDFNVHLPTQVGTDDGISGSIMLVQQGGDKYGSVLTRDTLLSGFEAYFPQTELMHPEVSPLWRDDFLGLPPVHILTAEYDPLCDDGEVLFARMTEQGVSCSAQRYLGVIHGFFQLGGISPTARNAMRDIAAKISSPYPL